MNPDIITLGGEKFFGFSHVSGNQLVLECEPYTPCPDRERLKHNHILSQLHRRLTPLQTVESLGTAVCEAIMGIIEYDRVDIMQFDADWHMNNAGTRHRSAYRLCFRYPECLAIVVSQDGSIQFVRHRDGKVVFWNQLGL